MVEHGGEAHTEGGGRLHDEEDNQVEHHEVTKAVYVTNSPVSHDVLQHGNEEEDGQVGKELAKSVDPHVVHVAGALTLEDGLLSLEGNDGRLEVSHHLHDTGEVDGSNHRSKVLLYFSSFSCAVVVQSPKHEEHEEGDEHSLGNLGSGETGLALSLEDTPVHELRELEADTGFVGTEGHIIRIGGVQLDQLVVVGDDLLLLDTVALFEVLDFL